ncbi:MAG: hypothetical protein GX851_06465 [Clostridiales bacterium]|nr:hypothetical protein [Clostridiales bacterium]
MDNEEIKEGIPQQTDAPMSQDELLAALELFSDDGKRKKTDAAAKKAPAPRKRPAAKKEDVPEQEKAEKAKPSRAKPQKPETPEQEKTEKAKAKPKAPASENPPKGEVSSEADAPAPKRKTKAPTAPEAAVPEEKPPQNDTNDSAEPSDTPAEPPAQSAQPAQTVSVQPRPRRKRRSRKGFVFGLFIILLACVGAWTVASDAAEYIKAIVRNDEQIAIYNTFLAPVVENDPDTFDDISKANPAQLLDVSIRALLGDNLDPEKYSYEEGALIIPQADVEGYFTKYFGAAAKPAHASVAGYGYEFIYDENALVYKVPITGVTPLYYASVVDTEKRGDASILTVAYMATEAYGRVENGVPVPAEPDKYMRITIRQVDSSYVITAIQNA